MSPQDDRRLAFWLGVLAVALLVVAVTGGCARNGLGGYELPKIVRSGR